MCAYVQANTQGRLHSADEPSISPLNRGFLYGDAIYEVWRTYSGVLFAWDEHWQRLQRSAEALYFELPFGPEQILPEIRKTVKAYLERSPGAAEIYVRLQISRGVGAIGLDIGLAEQTSFVLLVQENKLFSPEKFKSGLALSIARDLKRNARETLNPAWKTGNYLNNILSLREARSRGADEVVICNQHGEITEAAVSNIAFVRDGVVVTPPLAAGILAGVTRRLLIEQVAPRTGIRVVEGKLQPSDLAGMSECFLLSSTKDITPVSRIDEISYPVRDDSITLRLKRAFGEYATEYSTRHPELRVL